MAFEKEIAKAKKITDEWLARSEGDEQYLVGVKKENVKWEKDYGRFIQEKIDAGEGAEALDMIESSRGILDDIEKQCAIRYKKHFDFARGAPRAGSVGVCAEIGLKPKDEAFKAVDEAMAKVLMAHSKQFKQTELAWTDDLEPRIKLLRSKLDTFEKLAKGSEDKMTAYAKQLAKDVEGYKAGAKDAIVKLKESTAEMAVKAIFADANAWVGGSAKIRSDQYKTFVDRVEMIDKIMALQTKNYGRILKAIPDDVRGKFMFARPLKTFEITHTQCLKDLTGVQSSFRYAAEVVRKKFPDVA